VVLFAFTGTTEAGRFRNSATVFSCDEELSDASCQNRRFVAELKNGLHIRSLATCDGGICAPTAVPGREATGNLYSELVSSEYRDGADFVSVYCKCVSVPDSASEAE
jgi:hypothetical protein